MGRLATALALSVACGAQDPTDLQIFHQPQKLCESLKATAWAPLSKPPSPDSRVPYACESRSSNELDPIFGLPGVKSPTALLMYRVSGLSASLADSISLSVSTKDRKEWAEQKKEFQAALAALFQALGVTMPRGLADSVAAERRYLYHAPYGTLWFSRVTRREGEEVLWFRMRKKE